MASNTIQQKYDIGPSTEKPCHWYSVITLLHTFKRYMTAYLQNAIKPTENSHSFNASCGFSHSALIMVHQF